MASSALPGETPTGLLYVNLGSPSAPTPRAVRAFLDEFLGDPLVVDVNPVFWWLLRKLVILPLRGPKSAELYRRIWTEDGSPLVVWSRRLVEALRAELGPGLPVVLAMRYGEPSIARGLAELAERGCRRVVLLTAFPQESRTTTGTVVLEARRALAGMSTPPELVVAPAYHSDPGFVEALAARVRAAAPEDAHHVFSFHGLPVRYVEAGDPYRDHCEATASALAAALGLEEGRWTLAYQSRFGREPWLEPDVAEVVPALAAEGRKVVVCAPSFTADCLETLEELGLRLPEVVEERGGPEPVVVPCLNDRPEWVQAAARIARAAAE